MALPAIIPLLAPLVAGGLSQLFGARAQSRAQDKTIRANRELAEYQYSKDLEMWNRANLYNSPAAQMGRFKEAGLNPNLIYGQGNPGNATTLPKYQAPRVDYVAINPVEQLPAILGMYQDFQIKQAQLEKLKVDTLFNKRKSEHELAKGDKTWQESRSAHFRALMDEYSADYKQALLKQQLKAADLENQKRAQDVIWKQSENYWRSIGATSSDHYLIRILAKMMMELGVPLENFGKN